MKNKIDDMLNEIPIPDDLDKSIQIGFERGRNEKYKKKTKVLKSLTTIAAIVTITIATVGIIGIDNVQAAIEKALQYVPGYNVIVDSEEGNILALQEPVLYSEDNILIKITAASKLNEHLNISVEGNYKLQEKINVGLKYKEDIIPTENWSRAGGGNNWNANYYFKLEDNNMDNNYILVLGDLEIPFTLEETKKVEDFLQLGNYSTDKGISIVALKKVRDDNKINISLLNQSENKIVADYPFKQSLWSYGLSEKADLESSMYLIDKEGTKTYPTIPSSFGGLMSEFYFDVEDREDFKLVLPYLKIRYPDTKTEKIKFNVPKEGEVKDINKDLQLGEFTIKIIDVTRKDEEVIVSLKTDSLEDEILEDIRVRGISGYATGINENTGNIELFINVDSVGNRFSMYFENPTTLLLGNWEIELD